MDSTKKNIQKKAALIQKFENAEKVVLSNTYYQPFQMTFQKKISIGKENKQGQSEIKIKKDEFQQQQIEINQLIVKSKQLDDQIIKNDQLPKSKLIDDVYQIENNYLDNFINMLTERNQFLNSIQSEINQNSTNFQMLEGDYLIQHFQKQITLEQQQYIKEKQEIIQIENDINLKIQELKSLDSELEILKLKDNQQSMQKYLLQKQVKQKHFAVQIIQEQYYCQKTKTRSYCVFHSKFQEYDQIYQPYLKIKNCKQLFFENLDSFSQNNNNENVSLNLWSSSKQKLKKINPYRNQFYKFDTIFPRKESQSKQNQYELLFRQIELFIKGVLYKQIDIILKNYSFNSQEYQLLYHSDLNENVEKLRKICEKEKNDNSNKLIVLLSDKNRGLIQELVQYLQIILQQCNNELVQVEDIIYNLFKFNIKEQIQEEILECKGQNIQMMIDCLKNHEIFTSYHFHLKIDIIINSNQRRSLHILMLNPLFIDNNELFCKQFKSLLKREKGFKEQLGNRIESIIKNCDKLIIITQIPEMIKIDGNQQKKISIIQSIVNFSSLLVVKQEI